MTRFSFLSLALLLLPISGLATSSPIVREIVVENRGPGNVDKSYVLTHIRSQAGAPLDRNVVARDERALLDTGKFSDVKIEVVESNAEVRLVYGVVGRWRLTDRPSIEGVDHFRLSRLYDWLRLYPGDLVDDHVVGARTREIVREYHSDHYASTQVTWKIVPVDREAGLATVAITVDEGKRTKVKHFTIKGNRQVKTRELLNSVRFRKWWNPLRFWRTMDYEAEDLLMYRVALRDAYLDRGFLDVDVAVPQVVADPKGRPTISVSIVEGIQYRLRNLSATGITLFPENEVTGAFAGKSGQVAAAPLVEMLGTSVSDYYGKRGYIRTGARPSLSPDPAAGAVDVVYQVREGELTYIHNVVITGNGRTKDKVIRRELTVSPGDLYDEVAVKRSRSRLQNLGYFSRVDSFPVDTETEGHKDLHVEVEEKSTGQFMIGAGYSSIDSVVGFVELSQGNFDILGWPHLTGGGQKLKFRSQFGESRTDFDISFVEPWFLDRKLALSVDLYRSDVQYTDYDVTRKGFAVGLTKPLPWNNRLELKYGLGTSDITDVSDTNVYTVVDTGEPYYFTDEEGKTTKSWVSLGLSHDTRNSSFVPTRGVQAKVALTVSGGPFGFDSDLYELSFKTRRYFNPWLAHVISIRGHYEVIEAYGDTDEVGLSDRLFLGGARDLRGFDYRDVGPKVVPGTDPTLTTSYRPLGGQSLAFASIEYTIPIVKSIRFASFYDIGNVWEDPYELDPGDLASNWGVGIRLDLPGFPIRIDRSWMINPDDDLTDEETWTFWIGHDFY